MEATAGNSRDTADETHPPGERGSMDTHMHVSYDSDLEITDESEDSDYYLDTEDSNSAENTDEDTEPPPPALHGSQTSSLRTRSSRTVTGSRGRSRGIMRPRIAAQISTGATANADDFRWNECDDFTPTMPVFAGEPVGITSEFPEVHHD